MRSQKRHLSYESRRNMTGYLFVLPFILGTAIFFIKPLFDSLKLSFSKIDSIIGFTGGTWAGMANYVEAFTGDVKFVPLFLQTIQDTLINTPLIVIFALILAVLLNKDIRCRSYFRIVYFLPFLFGSGLVMNLLLGVGKTGAAGADIQGFTGVIALPKVLMAYMSVETTQFINELLSRITGILWKSGVQILLFLSGLQSISPAIYEAARCDSATEWEMFWKITLPMISPMMLVNIVYTIIDAFNDINNPIVQYFVTNAFRLQRYDYASALSWIYFTFVFLLILLVFGVMRRVVFYSDEREAVKK